MRAFHQRRGPSRNGLLSQIVCWIHLGVVSKTRKDRISRRRRWSRAITTNGSAADAIVCTPPRVSNNADPITEFAIFKSDDSATENPTPALGSTCRSGSQRAVRRHRRSGAATSSASVAGTVAVSKTVSLSLPPTSIDLRNSTPCAFWLICSNNAGPMPDATCSESSKTMPREASCALVNDSCICSAGIGSSAMWSDAAASFQIMPAKSFATTKFCGTSSDTLVPAMETKSSARAVDPKSKPITARKKWRCLGPAQSKPKVGLCFLARLPRVHTLLCYGDFNSKHRDRCVSHSPE